jgi:hypothetical protein
MNNPIDIFLLHFLIFGAYSGLLIMLGFYMGRKTKTQYVKGDPVLEPQPMKQPNVIDFEDPYREAIEGPPKKKGIQTL